MLQDVRAQHGLGGVLAAAAVDGAVEGEAAFFVVLVDVHVQAASGREAGVAPCCQHNPMLALLLLHSLQPTYSPAFSITLFNQYH